jgi:hypothetical protein
MGPSAKEQREYKKEQLTRIELKSSSAWLLPFFWQLIGSSALRHQFSFLRLA